MFHPLHGLQSFCFPRSFHTFPAACAVIYVQNVNNTTQSKSKVVPMGECGIHHLLASSAQGQLHTSLYVQREHPLLPIGQEDFVEKKKISNRSGQCGKEKNPLPLLGMEPQPLCRPTPSPLLYTLSYPSSQKYQISCINHKFSYYQ
jgi:hypothetical protein